MECPHGYDNEGLRYSSITDECECRTAADALGLTFNNAGCHETKRPGCFQSGEHIFFSICAKRSPSGNHEAVWKRKCSDSSPSCYINDFGACVNVFVILYEDFLLK